MHPLECQIDLWCVFLERIADPGLWDAYRGLLSPEEAQRERRFTHEPARRQFVAGRALLRTVLSQYTGIDPRRLEFQCNRYGKPSLSRGQRSEVRGQGSEDSRESAVGSEALQTANQKSEIRNQKSSNPQIPPHHPLEFSLSHTRGLVVCAVALRDAVGVDLEWPGREVARAELSRRFFAPAEADWLAALPATEQRAAFFELWTLKEAFIKAVGVGMAMPLADFAFSLAGHDSATISFAKPHGERSAEWQFHRLRLPGEHQAAVAIRRPAAQRSEIVIREVVPGPANE
jgi:4'-phosphopantetheinyl transferase